MTARTSAGATLAISATLPGTFNEAGFDALVWTPIKGINNIGGTIGRTYTVVTHNPLETRGTEKIKGSFNSGSITADMAVNRADPGQTLLDAAIASDLAYSYRLTEQDGSILYFTGLAISNPVTPGNVDSINSRSATIEITIDEDGNDFVELPAS